MAVLTCTFLITSDVDHLFHVLLALLSLEKCLRSLLVLFGFPVKYHFLLFLTFLTYFLKL